MANSVENALEVDWMGYVELVDEIWHYVCVGNCVCVGDPARSRGGRCWVGGALFGGWQWRHWAASLPPSEERITDTCVVHLTAERCTRQEGLL